MTIFRMPHYCLYFNEIIKILLHFFNLFYFNCFFCAYECYVTRLNKSIKSQITFILFDDFLICRWYLWHCLPFFFNFNLLTYASIVITFALESIFIRLLAMYIKSSYLEFHFVVSAVGIWLILINYINYPFDDYFFNKTVLIPTELKVASMYTYIESANYLQR